MITETLTFKVTPKEFAKDFLHVDNMVWTPWLKRQPGFLNKVSAYTPEGTVTLSITWASRKDLESLDSKSSEMEAIDYLMKTRCPGNFKRLHSSVTEM